MFSCVRYCTLYVQCSLIDSGWFDDYIFKYYNIQSMKSGVVTLTVRNGNGKLPRGSTLKRNNTPQGDSSSQSSQPERDGVAESTVIGGRFEVTLVKEAGRPLGLQLTDVRGKDALHSAVAIRNIAPNSPAKKCGNLE